MMKSNHAFAVVSSLALCMASTSCKPSAPTDSSETTSAIQKTNSYSSDHNFKESDFSKWMSKADQQIAYENRDKKKYFAYTEGRCQGGFQQYRHVLRPLPTDTHSEWAVYWGLSSEEFYAVDLKLQKAGFERAHLQVFEDGSGKAFSQAVWLKKK